VAAADGIDISQVRIVVNSYYMSPPPHTHLYHSSEVIAGLTRVTDEPRYVRKCVEINRIYCLQC